MPSASLDAVLTALEKSPDTIPSVPNLSAEDAQQLKDSLDVMYAVRAYHDVPLDQFVSDISEAMKINKELDATTESSFRQRVTKLLDLAPLRVSAKAAMLHAEHEHSFCTTRILTDIRPIYDDGAKGPPSGAIITHTLKLSFHEGDSGDLREIYVAMGSDDISELRTVLDRALDKAIGLRKVLEAAQVRYIDPQK
jgi:hypothetical protein